MSIVEQPGSNTKTGGMMRKINLTLTGVLAVLAFVFTLGAGPIHAQVRTVVMPACPIKGTIVPPTKTPFVVPNLQRAETLSVTGTVQVTDQNGDTVSLTQYDVGVDDTRIIWNRTLNTLQLHHWTGSLSFDKGCTKTDPFGSNNCTWDSAQNVTAAYQGTLQEDVMSGKIIGDLTAIQSVPGLPDNTTNVQFTCPVCGGTCIIPVPTRPTITIPTENPNKGQVWDFMTFPLFLTTPLPIFRLLIGGFANSQSHAQ